LIRKEFVALLDMESTPPKEELLRPIPTFKGLFMQVCFDGLADDIHYCEDQVNLDDTLEWVERMPTILATLRTGLKREEDELLKYLGVSYESVDHLLFPKKTYNELLGIIDEFETSLSPALVTRIRGVGKINLEELLKRHASGAVFQAYRLGKQLNEVDIVGECILLDSERFGPFLFSLVHVFRNAVVHGIGTPDYRESLQKNPFGTLKVSQKVEAGILSIRIEDDGSGIDIGKLRARLSPQQRQAYVSPEQEMCSLFELSQNTDNHDADKYSGRVIGLSAVKQELDKVGGSVVVESEVGVGTTFIFNVPVL